MGLVGRIVGFLIGGALALLGLFFWMVSNDGVADESSLKALGAAGMIVGTMLCAASLFWNGRGHDPRERDL